MKKYIIFFFIVLVGFAVDDVQKELIVLKWNNNGIAAQQTLSDAIFTFESASFIDEDAIIPVFARIYDLPSLNHEFKFVIENQVFREVPFPVNSSGFEEIKDYVEVFTEKLSSSGSLKLQLRIVPLKKENGRLFILEQFELRKIHVKTNVVKSGKSTTNIHSWKTSSALKQGDWVKISTSGKGIYKIPYSKLVEWGFTDPTKVNVFGSGGIVLSENPGNIDYDDLVQNAVWHGKNNGTDCLFFYAPGTVKWTYNGSKKNFEHKTNEYSTKGFFFLTENVGSQKIVDIYPEIQQAATHSFSSFNDYKLYENDLENILPLGSGKQWVGEKFRNNSVKSIDFELTGLVVPNDIRLRINAVSRSFRPSQMNLEVNQTEVGILNFQTVNTGSQTSSFANEKEGIYNAALQNSTMSFNLKYFVDGTGGTDENATAWLDFVEVNYPGDLQFGNDVLFFREATSVGEGNIVEFILKNASAGKKVFDVTDLNTIKEIPLEISGNVAKIKRPANTISEYAAFDTEGNFLDVEWVGKVENQDLHSLSTPEFVIITHSNFINAANSLADFHRSYDGMSVEVVTANQVYNEFSSGAKDATGIRNFIKMFYDRNNGLKYVLLFGDGSFDNRNIRKGGKNFIPTFQSENSLSPVGSFVTDDYFVILDDNESVYNGAVDLGIGRIPASTTYEAEVVVNKILNYYKPEALGEWRNTICFIGDDEDGNLHMSDSEKLANIVNENHKAFLTDKIYFDAFPEIATPAGQKYPAVTDAINSRVKDGVLVLNYVGHANERFLADEHVLDVSHINSWSNKNNLPIFVTATCEFSRFDADDSSAGEYILFNPNGGGIGLFSTTRLVFAYSNFLLSRSFYNFIFETDENGNRFRMGDIMRLAKINTINTTNKRNFSLLADPALKLSYPKHKVVTSSLNGRDAGTVIDTIGALQRIDVEGFISDYFGNKLTDFNGEISITVYDKEVLTSSLGNGGETPMKFKVQENIIYKGLASVDKGVFLFSFVLPKDISYEIGRGKIIYYAKSQEVDAHGAFEDFAIGGSSDQNVEDNIGPEIELFMNSQDFTSGDKTSKSPILLAFLSDENGINTAGTGIGHDITAVLNDDYTNVIVLNNYYQSNINDYTSGMVRFPFQNLAPGKHKLTLKAWDVANNSSEVEIEFEVSGDFFISEVINSPNPVSNFTFFTFNHNQSDLTLNVVVEIFDQMGRRVDFFTSQVGSNGTSSNPIRWDFSETGTQIRNGIYIYRVTAQNNEGILASKSGKLLIAR